MPPIDWTNILADAGLPPGWVIAGFLGTNILSFVLARGTSKDKVKSSMLEQTVSRQKDLDERQNKMFDELQEEFTRVRGEMSQIRQELAEERRRFTELSQKYTTLTMDNHSLRQTVEHLRLALSRSEAEKEELRGSLATKTEELFQANVSIESFRREES